MQRVLASDFAKWTDDEIHSKIGYPHPDLHTSDNFCYMTCTECSDLMHVVVASDGHTYDAKMIRNWIRAVLEEGKRASVIPGKEIDTIVYPTKWCVRKFCAVRCLQKTHDVLCFCSNAIIRFLALILSLIHACSQTYQMLRTPAPPKTCKEIQCDLSQETPRKVIARGGTLVQSPNSAFTKINRP